MIPILSFVQLYQRTSGRRVSHVHKRKGPIPGRPSRLVRKMTVSPPIPAPASWPSLRYFAAASRECPCQGAGSCPPAFPRSRSGFCGQSWPLADWPLLGSRLQLRTFALSADRCSISSLAGLTSAYGISVLNGQRQQRVRLSTRYRLAGIAALCLLATVH